VKYRRPEPADRYGCRMAWGRTEEEKAADRAAELEREAEAAAQRDLQRQAAVAREEEARQAAAAAAYAQTPVGRALTAFSAGAQFFQIELTVSQLGGEASFFGSSTSSLTHVGQASDALGQIEQVGWRLEHAGWTFIETGATSSDTLFGTGQGTVTQGEVTGIYLFRRVPAKSS